MVPQALSFARNHAGKPHLQWEGGLTTQQRGVPLHFNLSHTATLLGKALAHASLYRHDLPQPSAHDPYALALVFFCMSKAGQSSTPFTLPCFRSGNQPTACRSRLLGGCSTSSFMSCTMETSWP